ncbi:right-handed parallel beta-helix repeat-containing protein [Dokdonella sp.]|uniref:NosD domain-containing protein n=1 Tax=Dokdonella sp. TaxID=2291710 RepID=UPI0025BAB13B|nr:right-handed parallel beta-helix repeat-containing protein [Dokdonella sp.]MBX3692299.1 right-handed parallel beta-helix repeat-containing protein [Dokdonella sp.]
MSLRTVCFQSLRAIVLAAATGLCVLAPRPAAALDLCVQSLSDLLSGLQQAQVPQADGTVTLRLVAQTYATSGDVSRILVNRLNLLGGYGPGCSTRTVDPANTVIDGAGTMALELAHAGLGMTVEGISFRNMDLLQFRSPGSCLAYGETVSFRRNIVHNASGGFGTFDIGNNCGTTTIENNLVRARYGLRLSSSPEVSQLARVTNNTFWGSEGSGLELFRNSDSATFEVQLSNNVFWNNAGIDVDLRIASGPVLVQARNNTWSSINPLLTLAVSTGTSTANPQLDANLRPIVPVSPSINSGNNAPPGGLPGVDIDGGPRLVGTAVDRGAYESAYDDSVELVVTNSNDSGAGSLRQAITSANLSTDFNTIRFAIPGNFGAILIPQSPYPDIVTPMRIDGFTQPGAQPNGNEWSNNATWNIQIAGSGGTVSHAFRVPSNAPAGARLELRGFIIGGFNNAVLLQSGSGHVVRGNHFGRFSAGVLGGSDNLNAIYVNGPAAGVKIGGIDPADRNSIAGHPDPTPGNGYGIYLGGTGDGHVVIGNLIGTYPDGNSARGHQVGLRVATSLGVVLNNLISGNVTAMQLAGSENLIVSNRIGVKALAICLPPCTPNYALPNTHGVLVYSGATDNDILRNQVAYNDYSGLILYPGSRNNELLGNRVYANQTFDMDLREPAGVNPIDNDALVGLCEEANCGRNFPQLDAAFGTRNAGRVRGSLSTSNGNYRVEFFAGPTCGPGGQGGAVRYLGFHDVVVSGGTALPPRNGQAIFDLPIESATPLYGQIITATATGASGNTSEYSTCVAYACDIIFRHGFEGNAETCPPLE